MFGECSFVDEHTVQIVHKVGMFRYSDKLSPLLLKGATGSEEGHACQDASFFDAMELVFKVNATSTAPVASWCQAMVAVVVFFHIGARKIDGASF